MGILKVLSERSLDGYLFFGGELSKQLDCKRIETLRKYALSFFCANSMEYAMLPKVFSFLVAFLAVRSYMGRKFQLVIKNFAFTVRGNHYANVNLNFSCCTCKKMRLFRVFL